MEITDLSPRYGAFYAPGFVVSVDGQALVTDLAIGISQAEVDLTLGAAGRFSFTVVGTFDLNGRAFVSGYGKPVMDILKFGATVEVRMGYGDHAKMRRLISGIITEVTTSFSEGGVPELSVAGYDRLFPLTLGKRSRSWKDKQDSDVVSLIASEYNLDALVDTTDETHAQIEQNQQSDLDLFKTLADRNHFEFYADADGVLHFAEPDFNLTDLPTLRWGESLFSFKPEANLAAQVSTVEVYGWDPENKRPIVGRASAGEEQGLDPRRQSGGQRLRAALNRETVLQVRQPVFTEAEAKRRAQALLDDHAKQFLTGEAECIGLPDLVPDSNVNLANLGSPFSKTYYIQQTTHKVDGSGYRTRVKVKEVSL